MRGVGQGMFLGVSTLAVIACQGCQSGAQGHYSASVQVYDTSTLGSRSASAPQRQQQPAASSLAGSRAALPGSASLAPVEPGPLLSADPDFSLSQTQTQNTPSISITPVLGREGLDTGLSFRPDFTSTRLSNTSAVVDFEGARKSANLITPVRSVKEFDASLSLSAGDAQTGFGFDVGLVPRVSVRKDGEFETRRFGGEIRIGQNFDQRGEDVDAKSWYLFAGADGEALVYEPYSERNWSNSMALRDQVTVGDMQAGVSFTQGGGQLSVSYIRREVSYSERGIRGEEVEDFAGVSFTLRR